MEKDIYKSLCDFADYLDNMPSGKDKGTLGGIFNKFTQCYTELIKYKWLERNFNNKEV